jgi:hypothetical protein
MKDNNYICSRGFCVVINSACLPIIVGAIAQILNWHYSSSIYTTVFTMVYMLLTAHTFFASRYYPLIVIGTGIGIYISWSISSFASLSINITTLALCISINGALFILQYIQRRRKVIPVEASMVEQTIFIPPEPRNTDNNGVHRRRHTEEQPISISIADCF